jgi:hypothetical protein
VLLISSVFSPAGQSINPALLSLDECPGAFDVGSLARSLFRVDIRDNLSSFRSRIHDEPTVCSVMDLCGKTGPEYTAPDREVFGVFGDTSLSCPAQYNDDSCTMGPNTESNEEILPDTSVQDESIDTGDCLPPSSNGTVDDEHDYGTAMKRRRSTQEVMPARKKKSRNCGSQSSAHILERYLSEESRKCEAIGHQPPQQNFLNPIIQESVRAMSKRNTVIITKILIHIASPLLIGGLQEILKMCRTQQHFMTLSVTAKLSRMERFHLIDTLAQTVSRCQLLRRHHILELFKDCDGAGQCTSGTTPPGFGSSLRKCGNPANKSVADVTARMMEGTFPAIDPSTDWYKAKYRLMSYIRRLGHRLARLETRFGKGILGLMLDRSIVGTDGGITDTM